MTTNSTVERRENSLASQVDSLFVELFQRPDSLSDLLENGQVFSNGRIRVLQTLASLEFSDDGLGECVDKGVFDSPIVLGAFFRADRHVGQLDNSHFGASKNTRPGSR